jgi:hypothetical protein
VGQDLKPTPQQRLYEEVSVHCIKVIAGGDVKRWAASMAEARAAKKEIVEATGIKPSSVIYQEADVSTDKVGLLAFLNDNLVQ